MHVLLVKAFLFSFFKLKNYIILLSLLYLLHVSHPHANHGLWPLFKKLLKLHHHRVLNIGGILDTGCFVGGHDDLDHLNQVLTVFSLFFLC